MSDIEYRFSASLESSERTISGIAIRYGDRAKIGSETEEIAPGAFGDLSDVLVNVQHDRNRPVARTGGNLTLNDSDQALSLEAVLPETREANDLLENVRAKILRGFSVGFRVIEDAWSGSHRTITRAVLDHIAVVDRPAYPASIFRHKTPRRRRRGVI